MPHLGPPSLGHGTTPPPSGPVGGGDPLPAPATGIPGDTGPPPSGGLEGGIGGISRPANGDDKVHITTDQDYSSILSNRWMANVPELDALINKWIKTLSDPNYTISEELALIDFEEELESTIWWSTHTEAWRTAEENRWRDNTTWEDNLETHKEYIAGLIARTGYHYTPEQLETLADKSLHGFEGGLTETQLLREIYKDNYDVDKELPTGTLTGDYDSLLALAEGNLLPVTDMMKKNMKDWSYKIAMGEGTLAQAKESIYDIASTNGHYSFLGQDKWDKWERNGMTLTAFLDPLRQQVADIWEQDVSRIDMTSDFFKDNSVITDANDPTVQRLATNRDIKRAAMADQKYLNTSAYKKDEAETQASLLGMFGVI